VDPVEFVTGEDSFLFSFAELPAGEMGGGGASFRISWNFYVSTRE
jgi:hypothetical protein